MALIPRAVAEAHMETGDLGFVRGGYRPLAGFRRFNQPQHRFRLNFLVAESNVVLFEILIHDDAWSAAGVTIELTSMANLPSEEFLIHDVRFFGPITERRLPGHRRYSVNAEVIAGGAGRLAIGKPEYEGGPIDAGTADVPSTSDTIDAGEADNPSTDPIVDSGNPRYL